MGGLVGAFDKNQVIVDNFGKDCYNDMEQIYLCLDFLLVNPLRGRM